ncbi:MAG TPA: porin family protein [Chitinophagaceae bacterium]|nr:porin family protein [Chitinophagaceae bacterium]
MKTIVITLAAVIFSVGLFAQDGSVFIKGGYNLANVSVTPDGSIDKAAALSSFNIGIMGDVPLGRFLALQPGILYTGKGTKAQSGQPTDASYYKATSNPYYIEVPLNLVIKLPLASRNSSLFFGAGPYAAIGVAGKNKTEGKLYGVAFNSSEHISFSNDDPTTFNEQEGAGFGIMRRFDFGLNGTAGLQLNTVMLSVNYGYGLTKINSTEANNNDSNKHRVLSFNIGFRL